MPTGVKTKEADMETYKNGLDLDIGNRICVMRENNDFLKRDIERGDIGHRKEAFPERWAHTSMFDRVSVVATGKNTALILGPKS